MSLFLSISPSGFPPGSESWPRFLNHSGYRCEGRTPTAALTHPSPALCALFTPRGPRQTPCFASDPPNISGLCTYLSVYLECPPLRCSGDKLPVAQLLHPFIAGLKIEWGKTREARCLALGSSWDCCDHKDHYAMGHAERGWWSQPIPSFPLQQWKT